ncbi:MAG: phosphoenolpyruvate--protein phosphotransferase [Opitutus sp.]|nr:phosphoenolpyruvate--protein phosphotransferase [Opitutus sp.]MCS6246167.1 phosphoenolpyruvate--protein phosphotransferase [Opitutus sp.]MCS6272988.1 phosphoenolpyruvate--protein phosphotransferase [Opitutus sp.]MCS6278506.1 phosphoenolpyruvate--protein phosphotransferase [Opitutus sp.]MCS6300092.1 phosphoenolpyruvate--protein phosphotransferase [Opitutus sp.]
MPAAKPVKPETLVQGISASHGIVYGQAFLYIQSDVEVPSYDIELENHGAEITRFEQAIVVTRQQIQKIMAEVDKNLGAEEAQIFDAHLLVLEDQALISETIREFETSGKNIETCFDKVSQRYIKAFAEIDDEYLRERACDIRDVAQRVLQNLLGQSSQNLSQLVEKRVVVANDVSPSDAAGIDSSQALAIVTDSGSKTSHAVIVARSMKVPAVVGLRDLTTQVQSGDWLLVDGYEGVVIINPSQQTLFRYGQIQLQKKGYEQRLMEANRRPAITLDGVAIALRANIEKVDEAGLVKEYLADGVGLFRTEFLYLSSGRIPSENEQYLAYKAIAEALAPAPVVIRTLDLGGDKPMAGHAHLFPKEDNPFLGYRAIRFCLDNPKIFKDQLRAILRASIHGEIRLMYPMISGREELARANAVLAECKEELTTRKIAFNPNLQVGTMIEIPSAAITADLLARDCDFFSIGTNDLIQYLLAIDRVNDKIAHLYEPTHPAVIRTLKSVVEQAHSQKIKVSVCGEMAGDAVYAPLLLGLGIDELSMSPPLIPAVKYLIRSMNLSDAQKLAAEALKMTSAKEILTLCEEFSRMRVKVS